MYLLYHVEGVLSTPSIVNFLDFPVSNQTTPEGFNGIALGRAVPMNHDVVLTVKKISALFIVAVENVFQNHHVGSLILVDNTPHVIISFPVFCIHYNIRKGLLSRLFFVKSGLIPLFTFFSIRLASLLVTLTGCACVLRISPLLHFLLDALMIVAYALLLLIDSHCGLLLSCLYLYYTRLLGCCQDFSLLSLDELFFNFFYIYAITFGVFFGNVFH